MLVILPWQSSFRPPYLAELRLEQVGQGAAGEARGEERLRRPHDLPLAAGHLNEGGRGVAGGWKKARGGAGAADQGWVIAGVDQGGLGLVVRMGQR